MRGEQVSQARTGLRLAGIGSPWRGRAAGRPCPSRCATVGPGLRTCLILSFALLVLLPGPGPFLAWATPDRMTGTADRLLAANATHFYVIRDIGDNRGNHYAEFRDQYLVEIAFDTHVATRHWLLRRMTLEFLGAPFRESWSEEPIDPPNVYAILQKSGAVPPGPVGSEYDAQGYAVENGDVVHQGHGGRRVLLRSAELRDIMRASLGPVAAIYGPDPVQDWMGSRLQLEPPGSLENVECRVARRIPVPELTRPGQIGLLISCDLFERSYGHAAFYVFPPVENEN